MSEMLENILDVDSKGGSAPDFDSQTERTKGQRGDADRRFQATCHLYRQNDNKNAEIFLFFKFVMSSGRDIGGS